jgi:hypothetical protein
LKHHAWVDHSAHIEAPQRQEPSSIFKSIKE